MSGDINSTNVQSWDTSFNAPIPNAVITNTEGIKTNLENINAINELAFGTQVGQMLYWDGTTWRTINPENSGSVLQMVGTTPTWVSNPDIVSPVVTVTVGTDTVERGSIWTDAGATADTGESAIATGEVNTDIAGTYTITYTATDASGNIGTATRTVTVWP